MVQSSQTLTDSAADPRRSCFQVDLMIVGSEATGLVLAALQFRIYHIESRDGPELIDEGLLSICSWGKTRGTRPIEPIIAAEQKIAGQRRRSSEPEMPLL